MSCRVPGSASLGRSLLSTPSRLIPSFSITLEDGVFARSAIAVIFARPNSLNAQSMTAVAASAVRPLPQCARAMLYPSSAVPVDASTLMLIPPTHLPLRQIAKAGFASHEVSTERATNSTASRYS